MNADSNATARALALYCVVAAAGGAASYILYFHRFECHMNGVFYINTFLLSCVATTVYLMQNPSVHLFPAILMTISIASAYLVATLGSMMFWRIFLNPLNKFPGPWPARLGNLYLSWVFRKSDAYYKLQAMHQKYGTIVRIGSNDLSIIDPTIMEDAYGKSSKATKGWFYDMDKPYTSMHSTRDKKVHDARRKVWSPAFSDKAIRDYELKILPLEEKLVEKIREAQGKPIDVRTWFNLFSFDAMALLSFGKNYGMLEKGEKHWALSLLDDGMQPLAYFFPSWLFRMMTQIPGAGTDYKKFIKFCVDELAWRVKNKPDAEDKNGSDIMSWILRAYQNIEKPDQDPWLQADARLLIVAGSDTTASTLTYLFYHLAQNPDIVEKLRQELRPLTKEGWGDTEIKQAPYLNGCINEALRLHPPVPSGVSRLTPPEGMKVGDRYIPGNTIFYMPQYVMGRDERIYTDANLFIPERWVNKESMIKNKDAFAPFHIGPMGCIGKSLAMMELRTLTARLVLAYDISFGPGEDGRRLLYETRDHFTTDPGQLDLVFNSVA